MSEKINKQHFFRARIHEGFKWRGENGLRGLDPADMQPVVDAEVGVAAAGRGHIKPCKRVLGSVHAPETRGELEKHKILSIFDPDSTFAST